MSRLLVRGILGIFVPLLCAGAGPAADAAEVDVRQLMIDQIDAAVPTYLSRQKTDPRYDPTGDPNGIMVGGFLNTFNCRKQEANYILAYLYREPRSRYYHDRKLLNGVVLSLDFLCRAQGSNGGLNEYRNQGGWCGVALPNGGNATRRRGKSSVVGFTYYCAGRSLVLLLKEPAFVARLSEPIDNDGDGKKNATRRDAYRYLIDDEMNHGKMPGAISNLLDTGRGHAPNQDTGALIAMHALNEAYALLSGGKRLRTRRQMDQLRDEILFGQVKDAVPKNYLQRWFSDKKMILEQGRTGGTDPKKAVGYDANYGVITLYTLGVYAKQADDKVTARFISHFMDGYQYFYVIDPRWEKGGYHEWRTARRSRGGGGLPLFTAGLCQDYHDSLKTMYAAAVEALVKKPELFFDWGTGLFQIDAVKPVDLLLNWQDPQPCDYVLPCNSEKIFVYRDYNGPEDPQANLEVRKTGKGPETVTWKAFNFNGGEQSFTYLPPSDKGN